MSPRRSDPAVRTALIESGARMLAERQPLSARRLAAEVGTSTQAVYTYFGSMEELRRALRVEGFARLAEHMDAVELSDDPVADLCTLGWSYCLNGLHNPDLYRVMFLEAPIDPRDAEVGRGTFGPLVFTIERAMAAGRFDDGDARGPAIQSWTMIHGMVTLVLTESLDLTEMAEHLPAMSHHLFVGFGDRPLRATDSIERAVRTMSLAPDRDRV